MLATAVGRTEKEIIRSVKIGVKDRMAPGETGKDWRRGRWWGRELGEQAGNHGTNENSRAHMIKSREPLLSETLLCVRSKRSVYTILFAPHGNSMRKIFLFPLCM